MLQMNWNATLRRMNIGSGGIVVNQLGQVLLIQRDDTGTFALPAGGVELNETPAEAAVREVKEETGLLVMPVRLVGLYFAPIPPHGYLSIVYRCIQRGGKIETSDESPVVGFYGTRPLPQSILNIHRERIEHGLQHRGGAPNWIRQKTSLKLLLRFLYIKLIVYPRLDRQRRRLGQPTHQPTPGWQAEARLIMQNDAGDILWERQADGWQLPGGNCLRNEAPWETAVRFHPHHAQPSNLSGIYPHPNKHHMTFVFTAQAETQLSASQQATFEYFLPDQQPKNADSLHITWIKSDNT